MNDPVFFEAAQGLALPHHARDRRRQVSATVSTTPIAITLGRQPTAREAERMGKYFDDTSRGLAASRKPSPRSSPISWKACRRPTPPPGWS